jgi:hypothetical protein
VLRAKNHLVIQGDHPLKDKHFYQKISVSPDKVLHGSEKGKERFFSKQQKERYFNKKTRKNLLTKRKFLFKNCLRKQQEERYGEGFFGTQQIGKILLIKIL